MGAFAMLVLFVTPRQETPLASELSRIVLDTPRMVDFSGLLKGQWRAICAVGAYQNPRVRLREFAAGHQLTLGNDQGSVPPDSELHDGQVYVAVVTENEVRWVANVNGLFFQGGYRCTLRNQPKLSIPIDGRE